MRGVVVTSVKLIFSPENIFSRASSTPLDLACKHHRLFSSSVKCSTDKHVTGCCIYLGGSSVCEDARESLEELLSCSRSTSGALLSIYDHRWSDLWQNLLNWEMWECVWMRKTLNQQQQQT